VSYDTATVLESASSQYKPVRNITLFNFVIVVVNNRPIRSTILKLNYRLTIMLQSADLIYLKKNNVNKV